MNKAALLLALSFAPAFAAGIAVEDAHAAPTVQGDKKGYHVNEKFGFQFKPPKKWEHVALKQDEQWIGAKYQCDRSYFWHDKDTNWTVEQTPEVKVVCLVKENMKEGVEVKEEEEGVRTVTEALYKDYDDFLKKTMSEGGFFKDTTEETKVGGVPVTQYIYRIEKGGDAPMFIVTWIYHTDEIDFAIQTVVLQSEYKKLKKTLDRTYKSFKIIPRSGEDLTADRYGWVLITRKEMDAADPKERRSKRIESESQIRKRAVETLPDDWEASEHDRVLVLSHVDKKLAKRMGEHAEAMIKWMETTFPYYGKGEYARNPILRIAKDLDEAISYDEGAGTGGGAADKTPEMEILVWKPGGGFSGYEIDRLNEQLMASWFYDRDSDLWNGMPQWLKGGLRYCIGGLRKDGRQMKWRENDYDRTLGREYHAKGIDTHPRQFLRFTATDFADAGGEQDRETFTRNRYMSYAFTRFLLSKEAKKNKLTKDLLETYISTLDAVVVEMAERIDALDTYEAPKTEEEEAGMAAARSERFKKLEREMVDAVYERAFGEWGDDEWDSVHKTFWDWL